MESNKIKHTMITLDLDTLDEKQLQKSLKILKKHGFNENVYVSKSPGGHGRHVRAWCKPEKALTLEELLELRKKAGDDLMRVDLDYYHGRQVGVLFTNKKKKEFK